MEAWLGVYRKRHETLPRRRSGAIGGGPFFCLTGPGLVSLECKHGEDGTVVHGSSGAVEQDSAHGRLLARASLPPGRRPFERLQTPAFFSGSLERLLGWLEH